MDNKCPTFKNIDPESMIDRYLSVVSTSNLSEVKFGDYEIDSLMHPWAMSNLFVVLKEQNKKLRGFFFGANVTSIPIFMPKITDITTPAEFNKMTKESDYKTMKARSRNFPIESMKLTLIGGTGNYTDEKTWPPAFRPIFGETITREEAIKVLEGIKGDILYYKLVPMSNPWGND